MPGGNVPGPSISPAGFGQPLVTVVRVTAIVGPDHQPYPPPVPNPVPRGYSPLTVGAQTYVVPNEFAKDPDALPPPMFSFVPPPPPH